MDIHFINGTFVETQDAVISVNDLSVLRGFAVFDFLRTYNRKPFHLMDHLKRLKESARLLYLEIPYSTEELRTLVLETLARNSHPESTIRIIVTGGLSPDGLNLPDKPQLLILVCPVAPTPPSWLRDGVKLITRNVQRFLPGAKTTNYIPAILCKKEAEEQKAIEAIYTDPGSYLLAHV